MKIPYGQLLLCTAVAAIFYSSCRKSEVKPVAKTAADTAAVNKQIALNLVQALNGSYGGTNINDGVKAQSNISTTHTDPIESRIVPLCGFIIDTTFSSKTTSKDTVKVFSGNFRFVYTCSTNRPDGYIVHDSLVYSGTAPVFKNSFTVAQNYTVKATDSTYKHVVTDGSILSEVNNLVYHDGFSVGYDFVSNHYQLHQLKMDIAGGKPADITSGTADFVSITSYLHYGQENYTESRTYGTITFLGNHQARLTITGTGKTFMIDLLAGTVKAI